MSIKTALKYLALLFLVLFYNTGRILFLARPSSNLCLSMSASGNLSLVRLEYLILLV